MFIDVIGKAGVLMVIRDLAFKNAFSGWFVERIRHLDSASPNANVQYASDVGKLVLVLKAPLMHPN